MSLINDALKRAKSAQQQTPVPPPDLPFRPVEPAQQRPAGSRGLLLPAALAATVLLALFLAWHWARTQYAAGPTEVTARTARATTAPPPARASAESGDAALAVAAQSHQSFQRASPSSPASAAAGVVVANPTEEPTNALVAAAQESDAANAAPVAALQPPKPAPLRLQGILFNPRSPSAMINGKTVFIGDKLGQLRVVAIDRDSATLVGAGQTNVLTLEQ